MERFRKIEKFLENIENDSEFEGDVRETFCDGDLQIRVNIHRDTDGHQSGSFSILFNSEKSFEELAKNGAYRVSDVESKYEEVEDEFCQLIDSYLGYNAYEPVFDKADRPEESGFDFVAHDSVVVYN